MLTSLSRDNRLIMVSLFCWGLGEGMFLYFQPLYLKELGASPVAIGSILSAAAMAATLAHMPAGYLADRFGRKRVLVAGWVLGFLATVAMYLAPDLRLFSAGLVAYTFTGFVIAPISAYVGEARGQQSIQRVFSIVWAGYWAGNVVSPALGGLIARAVELRAIYGLASVAFLASNVAMLLVRSQPRTPTAAGRGRYAGLFRNRRFLGFLALISAALVAMQIGLPFMPNFVVEVRGFDVGLVGVLGSANAVGTVTANLALGQRHPRRALMLAQGLLGLSMLLLLVTTTWPWLLLAYFLRAGWSLAHGMGLAQVGRVVEPAETGLAYGMAETVIALAAVVGPFAAGLLYARNPAWPFQASLALAVVTGLLVWRFAPRRDPHSELEDARPVGI